MQLDYLVFDSTDEADGSASFDALASVMAERMPALAAEIAAVLGWARRSFGAPAPLEDGADWDFELQAVDENGVQSSIAYDFARNEMRLPGAPGRSTVALTISGSRAFASAFTERFGDAP
jgi:hypothetical protein